jgi:uncharacterized membrane protein YjjB (DUF3815 family)
MHRNPKAPENSAVIVAVVLGVIAGSVDLVAGSPQIAAAFIVVFAFLLSLTYPKRAWLWALLTGMFVPLINALAVELGYGYLRRPESLYAAYLAFVPAFIGAYSAAFLRRYTAKQEQKEREASKKD